MFSKE